MAQNTNKINVVSVEIMSCSGTRVKTIFVSGEYSQYSDYYGCGLYRKYSFTLDGAKRRYLECLKSYDQRCAYVEKLICKMQQTGLDLLSPMYFGWDAKGIPSITKLKLKPMNYAQICDTLDKLNKSIEASIVTELKAMGVDENPVILNHPLEVVNVEDYEQPFYIHAVAVEGGNLYPYISNSSFYDSDEVFKDDNGASYLHVEDLTELLFNLQEYGLGNRMK